MANERVIAYTRVSSAQQATDDKTSHDYQEQRIRLACERKGYKVVQVLKEVGKRWELDRPELTKARNMIKNREADVLMAMVMDRLSSERTHLYILLDEIERHGGRLKFADQEFEDTPEGEFLWDVHRFTTGVELVVKGARSHQGAVGAALAGAPLGRRPFGYRIEGKKKDRHYVVDTDEKPTVRRIFRDVADGVRIQTLARNLEEEGVKTSIGGDTWSTPAIRSIIHNTVYKGMWRGQKTRTTREKINGKWKSKTRPQLEERQGPIFRCEPLVSDDLWEAANARLKLIAEESARNNRHPESHLVRQPFGFCGECGHSLHCTPANSGRKARYICGNTAKGACSRPSVLQAELDAEVWERVSAIANNPGAALKKLIDQAHDGTLDSRIAELEKDVQERAGKLNRLLDGVTRAYIEGDNELAEGLKNNRKPILKVQEEAQAELAALQEQAKRQAEFEALPSQLEQMLKEDDDQFENMTWQQKRSLMQRLNLRTLLYEAKPDMGLKPGWVHPPEGDTPIKPLSVADRTRIMMTRLPEHLFGWRDDIGDWDFDPEYLIETAARILNPVELSDEAKQKMAQAKLTPEQLKAHNAYLASLKDVPDDELYDGQDDEDESRIAESSPDTSSRTRVSRPCCTPH